MKKIFFCLFFLAACSTCIYSQSDWMQQNSGTSADLTDVFFINEDTGWVIGDGGTILCTKNGGETWEVQNSQSAYHFKGVHFSNSMNGWTVGSNGTYRYTTNGGETWNSESFVDETLTDVFFLNDTLGWISSEGRPTIYKSVDGGLTWIGIDSNYYLPQEIQFLDENLGWAGGSGEIIKTTDGGYTWTVCQTETWVHSLHFVNNTHGWVAGSYNPYRTVDAGLTWEKYDGLGNGVFFIDTLKGWLVGPHSNIKKTIDGGISWITQNISTNEWLNSVFMVDSITGWAVGLNGTILKATNGGNTSIHSNNQRNYSSESLIPISYPNPFNITTTIKYHLPKSGFVKLTIYNSLGQKIESLVDEYQQSGQYENNWTTKDLNSGFYFYKLEIVDPNDSRYCYSKTNKLILNK